MRKPAIEIQNVSKQYRLGQRELAGVTFREAAMEAFKAPLRRLRKLGTRNEVESFWALRDVSFDVPQGEVVGIIGRNGAGKSTLLKILSRITEPTKGRVRLRGRVASLLEVGTGFHPDLTGRENVYLNAAILGMKKTEIDRKFDAIVAFAEVAKFLDTPVKYYSSGMYVRLAFAVAAHIEPEILVVDEVLAVGDAQFQKKCLGKMSDVAKQGRTILFVSHNMAAVRSLCRRAIWLDQGAVRQDGPVSPVSNAFLQQMLATTSAGQDLACLPRADGMGQQVRVEGYEFNGGRPLQHGEPLVCRIKFHAFTDSDDVALGFGFNNLDGARLLSFDSDVAGSNRDLRAGQHGELEFTLPRLDLEPGTYILHVGARSGLRNMLDAVVDGLWVEVLPGPRTPDFIIGQRAGLRAHSPCTWDVVDGNNAAAARRLRHATAGPVGAPVGKSGV